MAHLHIRNGFTLLKIYTKKRKTAFAVMRRDIEFTNTPHSTKKFQRSDALHIYISTHSAKAFYARLKRFSRHLERTLPHVSGNIRKYLIAANRSKLSCSRIIKPCEIIIAHAE